MDTARIFVVEDEAMIALEIKDRLSVLGYDVCGSAARGEDAVQRIPALKPDLVLMDVNLAGPMTGITAAEQLGPLCDVPIVFLSAFSDSNLLAQAAHANPFGYLVKPYEERALHATIQMALAKHRVERTLRAQAVIDTLSGLYNRRFLDESLHREVARALREGLPLSAAMLDIDHFKLLNDTHGHDAGDHVIKSLALLIRRDLRRGDLACRYGGEEFTLIMPGAPLSDALRKVEAVCERVRDTPIAYGTAGLRVTLSAGVATLPGHGGSAEALLHAADAALYAAKQAGRDRVCTAQQ
ncbi:MAG: diguanylate cyclase [Betaproteobacteria bacterium]|nr:diguanylate cyclase [Betaproteobacteria bacterium]